MLSFPYTASLSSPLFPCGCDAGPSRGGRSDEVMKTHVKRHETFVWDYYIKKNEKKK